MSPPSHQTLRATLWLALRPALRRALCVIALVPAILVTTTAGAAFATAPSTWEPDPSVSVPHALLVIVVIPAALFALITLLVFLPTLRRDEAYRPGQAWRNEPTWFGGPRSGVEAIEDGSIDADTSQGGASGRW